MALDFPNAPTLYQSFSAAGRSWLFDGAKWLASSFNGNITTANSLVVHATIALPSDFGGYVWVENTSGGPITVTLPGGAAPGQHVVVKDAGGNAATFPITVAGMIDGNPTYLLMSNFMSLDVYWMGGMWGTC